MAIIAKTSGDSNFAPIPEGVHVAICYSIVDLGMQYSELYDKSTHKVLISWELPEEKYTVEEKEEEKPRAISKEYSLSLSDKSILRKDLQAWRGKAFTEAELEGFDLKNVLGKGCQLQVIHSERNGKTYSNIASIMGLPKGTKLDNPANELVYFDMSDPETIKLLSKIPQWVQDKIKASSTYKGLADSNGEAPLDDDELPFN